MMIDQKYTIARYMVAFVGWGSLYVQRAVISRSYNIRRHLRGIQAKVVRILAGFIAPSGQLRSGGRAVQQPHSVHVFLHILCEVHATRKRRRPGSDEEITFYVIFTGDPG